MKYYDFAKAKELINAHLDDVISAELGMSSDWGWTSKEVYNSTDGFVINLDSVESIAGIDGSSWDRPTLKIEFKDGRYKEFSAYKEGLLK